MKSHVSLAQKFCPICGEMFNSGEILLETRISVGELVKSFDYFTCIGVDLCPKHMSMVESDEYVAFFVCEERDCGKCDRFKSKHGTRYAVPNADECVYQHKCNAGHYSGPPPTDGGSSYYMRRTGDGFMMRREVAVQLFNATIASINHCDMELFNKIKNVSLKTSGEEDKNHGEKD